MTDGTNSNVTAIIICDVRANSKNEHIVYCWIDEEDAGTATAELFTHGFNKPSRLVGISSDYLLRNALDYMSRLQWN